MGDSAEDRDPWPRSGRWLVEAVREFAPLAAALGLIVYVLGGAVLFARLALADLPEKTVVGYLPRDFLMMIGITEVFVPGAIAAAAHAAWCSLGPPGKPLLPGRTVAVRGLAWAVAAIAALVVISHWNARDGGGHTHVAEAAFWVPGIGACLAAVCGAALVRWRLQVRPLNLKIGPPWMVHTIVYGVAAMVVATVIATTVPLPVARVCLDDGTGQSGTFIGESAERIFLGEDIPRRPHITLLRSEDVDRLLIGHDAKTAPCE